MKFFQISVTVVATRVMDTFYNNSDMNKLLFNMHMIILKRKFYI